MESLTIPNATPGHIHFHHDTSTDRVDLYLLGSTRWEECMDRWVIAKLATPITHPLAPTIILDTYGENKWLPNYIQAVTYKQRKHAYSGLKRYNQGVYLAT